MIYFSSSLDLGSFVEWAEIAPFGIFASQVALGALLRRLEVFREKLTTITVETFFCVLMREG